VKHKLRKLIETVSILQCLGHTKCKFVLFKILYIFFHFYIHHFHDCEMAQAVPVATDLRNRSAAARLLRLCVRIPPETWMFVCCEYCVLSGRGPCDELITCPEDSYRLCCVVVCDLWNFANEEALAHWRAVASK
jgi:hypothetical protein